MIARWMLWAPSARTFLERHAEHLLGPRRRRLSRRRTADEGGRAAHVEDAVAYLEEGCRWAPPAILTRR
jgi:hypothetical protein